MSGLSFSYVPQGDQYFTQEGLNQLAGDESSYNPTATTGASSAAGLYGFTTGTWQQYAPQAGVDIGQYPTADTAPGDVQTQVAAITPASNWLCPGCDSAISNSVNQNSGLLSPQPTTGVTSPAADTGTGTTSGSSLTGSGISFWDQLVGDVENWSARFGLIVIGVILLAAAAFAMSNHEGGLGHAIP